MLHGKKILDDVAEALDPDAQAVKRNLGAIAQSAVVELASRGPALQREMLEQCAARANASGARGKRFAPLAPLLAVELFESGLGFVLLLVFAAVEDFEKRSAARRDRPRSEVDVVIRLRWRQRGQGCPRHRAFCGMQLLDPFHHHLDVAQCAEALKQALAGLLHRLPVRIGIEGHQSVRHGAAAAQGDAQVVNRIGTEIGGDVLALFQNPQHPVAQAGCFLARVVRVVAEGHKEFQSIRIMIIDDRHHFRRSSP